MSKKITLYIVSIIVLFFSILSLYRACLHPADMNMIKGKVLNKEIAYSIGKGRHYYLALTIGNRADKIAINLGAEHQAEDDKIYDLIDVNKVYVFFMDPTVPTNGGLNVGIRRIEYNGTLIFEASEKLNLYGGSIFGVFGIVMLIVAYKGKNKTVVNT